MNSVYIKGSMELAQYFKLKSEESLFGLTDYTVPNDAAKTADLFVSLDKKLLAIGKKISGFYTVPDGKVDRIYSFKKALLASPQGDNIGILTTCIEIETNEDIDKFSKIKSNPFYKKNTPISYIQSEYLQANLSARQSHCLFYLLRGKSAKAIGQILNLSPRTVEGYVDEVKNKMSCNSKAELIEKLINNGYIEINPKGIKT